ncbi:28S ribosomal protein S22, mitochondrial [Scaptodrosophila lebanonensis]|uniref:28S ribosomal protein S22, mitochondrial n=1 Tax=Drosophila lebanonensis TaxID=7225 RepID=A0A6J2T1Z6_DROLE|nr:28S ribosomal protein S22, mitochondrial [Scaptodrosophila lebanonensis]
MSFLRYLRKINTQLQLPTRLERQFSNAGTKSAILQYEKDPQPQFTDTETQRLLQSMTQMQLDKVFRKRTVPDNDNEIKFMTTEQLENEFVKMIEKAKHQLQMPPVVKVKQDTERIISKDPALKDFQNTKFVFTDITYGLRQSDRKVVVRDVDGTLSYAPLETQKRMNQLYFPLKGRTFHTPRMFSEQEYLQRCLDDHKYEFVLDRLTVQYEPYELDFHQISAQVFQHLNESKEFDQLRSTRHFGPMAFFYAWHHCIDDLLYDMIRRDYLQNAVELIALSYKLHNVPVEFRKTISELDALQPTPEKRALNQLLSSLKSKEEHEGIQQEIQTAIGKAESDFAADEISLKFIEAYIASEHALKKVQLELAVQTLKEINLEKLQLYHGLKKAHGMHAS